MKQVRRTLPRLLRLLALTALMATGVAHADDYAEITQLLKNGKAADALTKTDQRLAANPRDPQLRFLRGVAQTDSGKQADAIATFTKLTEEYPELPEPYNNLAVLYAQNNDLEKASRALQEAVRANPNYATAYENLGDIYIRLAEKSLSRAGQLAPAQQARLQPKISSLRLLMTRAQPAESAPGTPALAAPADSK